MLKLSFFQLVAGDIACFMGRLCGPYEVLSVPLPRTVVERVPKLSLALVPPILSSRLA